MRCLTRRLPPCFRQIEAGGVIEVMIPIKPLVEAGEFDVTIKCITQFGLDVEEATVEVSVSGDVTWSEGERGLSVLLRGSVSGFCLKCMSNLVR